jgi:hypothetical protein
MDLDRFEERAAIMEFDGGMTRFQAETLAAQAQGRQRWEFKDEISKRNSEKARDQRSADARHPAHDLPGMQRASAQEVGPLSKRNVQA